MGELVVPKTTDKEFIEKGDFSVWHPFWHCTSGFTVAGGKALYDAPWNAIVAQFDVPLVAGHQYRIQYTCDSLVHASHNCSYQAERSDENFGAGTFIHYFTAPSTDGVAGIAVTSLADDSEAIFDNFSIFDWPPGGAAAYTFCTTYGFCPGEGHRFEHWKLNGNIMQGIRNRKTPMNILYKTEPP